MRQTKLTRRTVLKGLGTITIGLPLLEEMTLSTAAATPNRPIPARAFNVFFGLGIPTPLQTEGFDGVLEPLKPLSDKLLIMRNIDQVRCNGPGNAHYDGSTAAFTAERPVGEAKSGGASIDQAIRKAHYPDGLPSGMISSLVAGTFFRRSRVTRYVHSYRHDGTIAGTMQETPRELFDRIFGSIAPPSDPNALRQRLKRSVLDSVVQQYKFYAGSRSPLGATSKIRLAEHLDRIRELEQRSFRSKSPSDSPRMPPQSQLAHGAAADPGGSGIDITLDQLTSEWRLMADLYALAIQTDRVRFGAITFLAAGERIRLTGEYKYDGRKICDFDDARQLRASGSKACSHEWWHRFNEKKQNEELRAHVHLKMREVAYFLHLLSGKDSIESNGKTILENSLITISTESGDGRHANVKRELSGIFHAISGANGRFKTGHILDVGAEGIDVYNTMLAATGVTERLGPRNRAPQRVDAIRA